MWSSSAKLEKLQPSVLAWEKSVAEGARKVTVSATSCFQKVPATTKPEAEQNSKSKSRFAMA
eukprot:11839960-Alexandrium_andersonii.AAC.1